MRENVAGYLLECGGIEWDYDRYLNRPTDARNEYVAPLLTRDLVDLPLTTVVTMGFDLLRDEGFAYADRLDVAGVSVGHEHFEKMIYQFIGLVNTIDHSRDAIAVLADDPERAFGR